MNYWTLMIVKYTARSMAHGWITDIGTQVVYVDAGSRIARMNLFKIHLFQSSRYSDLVHLTASTTVIHWEFYALKVVY